MIDRGRFDARAPSSAKLAKMRSLARMNRPDPEQLNFRTLTKNSATHLKTPTCYASPMTKANLQVKPATTGLGLFTVEAVQAHQRIIEYTGTIITTEERNKRGGKFLFEIDKHYAIDGQSPTNLARYINHSCHPNSIAYIEDNQVWVWSRKRIQAGEEITINYGKEYFTEFIKPIACKCKKCAAQK
jgi:hypothetical protein